MLARYDAAPMRSPRKPLRTGGSLLAVGLTLGVSACGSTSATNATSGAQIFTSAGCSGCHTLAAADANGTIGPNLDSLKPPYGAVVAQVSHGGGGMPSFSGSLSQKQIAAVARYVSSAAR